MVMVPQAVPELKRFLQPLRLKDGARTMLIRMVTAFMLHAGRMTAWQAAGTIQTDPCHRAQVCRSLGRKFWAKYDPLQVLRAGMLSLEKRSGRYLFIIDQTLHGQQGQLTENTYSTGNRQRRPRKGVRHRRGAALADGQPGGDVGVGRDDDLVAGADIHGAQGEVQGIEAVGNADAMRCLAVGGEVAFEGFDFGAEDVPACLHRSEHG